jgi:serine/threonine protein kinase
MPSANQRISEYVLETKIGGGTFGEVWRAHHHVWTDQLVAIKIPTDTQYLRNLQREGAAIHGMVHPNIVRAIGFDPYAETPYLTMEYVPGTSLRPLIAKKALNSSDAVAVMKQVLAGLDYAHKNGMVHRDIKPENVLVHERALRDGFNTEGVVKVTDFGLGKAASGTTMGSIAYSQSLNSPAGQDIAGTLDYMAPEQRTAGTIDGRADLYACGVMLYELLTGERPAGTDLPSDLQPSVPKYLDDVFKRSYARLDKRFASAADFSKALSVPMPPPVPKFPTPMPPRLGLGTAPNRGGFGGPTITQSTSRSSCPQCRQPVDPSDQFCMHCGVQLVSVVRRCPKCGAFPDSTDKYCIFCGETLSATGAMV